MKQRPKKWCCRWDVLLRPAFLPLRRSHLAMLTTTVRRSLVSGSLPDIGSGIGSPAIAAPATWRLARLIGIIIPEDIQIHAGDSTPMPRGLVTRRVGVIQVTIDTGGTT